MGNKAMVGCSQVSKEISRLFHSILGIFIRFLTELLYFLEHRWSKNAADSRFSKMIDHSRRSLPSRPKSQLQRGVIVISEEEIKDRSKGDGISKTVVVVQTGWFVLQCAMRAVWLLPLTELEVLTLAHSALSFVIYACWWNKPLDVNCPVRIPIEVQQEQNGGVNREGEGRVDSLDATERENENWWVRVRSRIPNRADRVVGRGMLGTILNATRRVVFAMASPVFVLARRIAHAADHLWSIKPHAQRAPLFYAGDTELTEQEIMYACIAAEVIVIAFGAIHCIAWSFHFLSAIEQLLWRVSSLSITCMPAVILLHDLLYLSGHKMEFPCTVWLFPAFAISSLGLYVLSRFTLMVLALMSLRSLPPGAYQTVSLTNLIPHI